MSLGYKEASQTLDLLQELMLCHQFTLKCELSHQFTVSEDPHFTVLGPRTEDQPHLEQDEDLVCSVERLCRTNTHSWSNI